jgi:hypothetical protein
MDRYETRIPQRSSRRISTKEKNSLRAQKESRANIHSAKVKQIHSDIVIARKNTHMNLTEAGIFKRPLLKYEINKRIVSRTKAIGEYIDGFKSII